MPNILSRVVLLWSLCGLLACSETGGGEQQSGDSLAELGIDDGASKGEKVIAKASVAEGATLKLSTGAELKIAAGALEKDTEIGLSRPPDKEALGFVKSVDATQKLMSAPYVVTPHGTKFKEAVQVTLPVSKDASEGKVKVMWLENEKDTVWKEHTEPTLMQKSATFTVDHFSVLLIVEDTDDAEPMAPRSDAGTSVGDAGSVGVDVDPRLDAGGTFVQVDAGDTGPLPDASVALDASTRFDAGTSDAAAEFSNHISFDGISHPVPSRLISDEGAVSLSDTPPTHHKFSFLMTDATFTIESDYLLHQELRATDLTFGCSIDLVFPGTSSGIVSGVYSIGSGAEGQWYVQGTDPEEPDAMDAESGTVEVSQVPGAYMLKFSMMVRTADLEGELVPVTGELVFDELIYNVGLATTDGFTLEDPTFSVTLPADVENIVRSAFTGSKLWALTGIPDGEVTQSQALLELDTSSGDILNTVVPSGTMHYLDYANGELWDMHSEAVEEPFIVQRYHPDTGAYAGSFSYLGSYNVRYFWTHDGSQYWGGADYEALLAYSNAGSLNQVFSPNMPSDLIYANGALWAAVWGGNILKLDADLNILEAHHVTNYHSLFGEAMFADEIPMQLEYFDGNLWLMDRSNNFYRTPLQ